MVDGGNKVVFGQQNSYAENERTGQRIPMSRRSCVFVVQLDAVTGSKANVKPSVFTGVTSDERKFREHCKTKLTL